MANKIKGFLIDVTRDFNARPVEFEDTLENIYRLLDVELIDVAECRVGENVHDFIVDDEGLLKDNAIPSVFDKDGRPILVGNVLIVNHDESGNFTSLTDEEIKNLKKHVSLVVYSDGTGRFVRCGVEQ